MTEKPVRWETVIITARERQSGKRYTMPAYYDDGEWCSLIIQLPLNDDVVCWQPLPAPPQE